MAKKTATATVETPVKGKGKTDKAANGKGKGKPTTPPAKGKGKGKATPTVKTERAPRAIKEGLRKPQIEILRALSKAKKPMTRPEIAVASEVDPTKIGDYAGPRPADRTEAAKARYPFPCLCELKYVKAESSRPATDGGRTQNVYTITAAGRIALQKADKEASGK